MTQRATDTRELARRLERNLGCWVMVFLLLVGGAVIALVYGGQAALVGAVCLGAGAGLFGLLYLILTIMERWANRED